jgi:hypothetical protein
MEVVGNLIAQDPLDVMGHSYGHKSTTNFIVHNNPVLNGVVSHTVLNQLDYGTASMELKEPIVTGVAILYRALFAIDALHTSWHDIECLIAFYGQEAIFYQSDSPSDTQEFYERAKLVLEPGAERNFLQPTEFQRALHLYNLDCSTEKFRALLVVVERFLAAQDDLEGDEKKQEADGIFSSKKAWQEKSSSQDHDDIEDREREDS